MIIIVECGSTKADWILLDGQGHEIKRWSIMGFNPYSPWAMRQRLGQWFKRAPRERRYYALGRVCDWLDLLDYELLSANRFGVGFPYLSADGMDVGNAGMWRIPASTAQAYTVVARKRVMAMTQQRKLQRRSVMPARGMPEPSTRLGESFLGESNIGQSNMSQPTNREVA